MTHITENRLPRYIKLVYFCECIAPKSHAVERTIKSSNTHEQWNCIQLIKIILEEEVARVVLLEYNGSFI